MNKRIIKDEIEYFKSKEIYNLPPSTKMFHPLNLSLIYNPDTTNPLCLTKFQMDKNNNLNILSKYKCNNNVNSYKKNLYIPVIGLESIDLLNMYSIQSIDSLNIFIEENNDKINFITMNRIINSWIRVNFETLKNYNSYLEKIFFKLFENDKAFNDTNETSIKKEIKYFIDYWITKHSVDEFNFNLFDDLIKYLYKKNLLNK